MLEQGWLVMSVRQRVCDPTVLCSELLCVLAPWTLANLPCACFVYCVNTWHTEDQHNSKPICVSTGAMRVQHTTNKPACTDMIALC